MTLRPPLLSSAATLRELYAWWDFEFELPPRRRSLVYTVPRYPSQIGELAISAERPRELFVTSFMLPDWEERLSHWMPLDEFRAWRLPGTVLYPPHRYSIELYSRGHRPNRVRLETGWLEFPSLAGGRR